MNEGTENFSRPGSATSATEGNYSSLGETARMARLVRDLETLEGAGIDDLQNLFSCLKASVESSRREMLLDCAHEYLLVLRRKILLAVEISLRSETNGLPDRVRSAGPNRTGGGGSTILKNPPGFISVSREERLQERLSETTSKEWDVVEVKGASEGPA